MSRIAILVAAAVTSALVACATADSEPSSISTAHDTVNTTATADASTDDAADASAPALPTYNEVSPLIAAHCGSCHHSSFSTLAKVKAHQADMIDVLESHAMPKNDPFWSDTADGQTLLSYLQSSPELQ